MGVMTQPKKKPNREAKSRQPSMYLRYDEATDEAVRAFIAAQPVPPDKNAVGLTALHQFLERHGFWPPKGER